jgi:hypothetical protein
MNRVSRPFGWLVVYLWRVCVRILYVCNMNSEIYLIHYQVVMYFNTLF